MTHDCRDVRESLSARLDGEAATLGVADVDHHLAGCDGCTGFAAGLPLLAVRVDELRSTPVADGTRSVLEALGAEAAGRSGPRVAELRWLLGLAAVAQVVLAVTTLLGTGGHELRDLAVLELAAAAGLGTAAWRPHAAAGVLPVIAVAGLAGVVAMVAGVADGSSTVGAELAHVVLLVAAWPLAVLGRTTAPGDRAAPA